MHKTLIVVFLLILSVCSIADDTARLGAGARAGFEFPIFRFHDYYQPSPVVGLHFSYNPLTYLRVIVGADSSVEYASNKGVSGKAYSIDPFVGVRLLGYPRTQFMPFIEGGGVFKMFNGPEFPVDPDGTGALGQVVEGGKYTQPGFYAGLGFDYLFEENIGMEVCIKYQLFQHNSLNFMSIIATGGVNVFLP